MKKLYDNFNGLKLMIFDGILNNTEIALKLKHGWSINSRMCL
jgi:hypothetical protein